MGAAEIMNSEEFKKCVEFHGHICPGLATGFRAAKVAMDKLKEQRSEDEEIVAIVETDACSADAVQVLTGCTFGKGNFIYKDYGKMALTLLSRNSGKGVRVSARPNGMQPDAEHHTLIQKMIAGKADDAEKKRFQELHLKRTSDLLDAPFEEIFNIEETTIELPPKARIEVSEICYSCGEPVMPSKMDMVNGHKVCRGCL
ncbi:Formylmethanofuran dehydrogenase subunit E region [Desulfamplus magnetovallimortis]|uniref:Formylmethanofuran dehydrogenase subunit E region n=1 Tax=Desulfamplus magnetovallimortis TaxID=1246637 RepID=A0A1W1HHD5_9BACT|nr:FmdE family protein [Desulfamplus magnetovallimortis]SLM31894.1 Formylmethanofuran dehydrogenase subunit E region [Desulfamplus magnetovallimortis]